jgi:hypothetical protein
VKTDKRAQGDRAQPAPGREHPADQRRGQRQEQQERQPPGTEGGLQQQQDDQRRGQPLDQQPPLRGGALGRLPQQRVAVAGREAELRQRRLDRAGHRAQGAAVEVGVHLGVALAVFPKHLAGGRPHGDRGHRAERDVPAAWGVDLELPQAGQILPVARCSGATVVTPRRRSPTSAPSHHDRGRPVHAPGVSHGSGRQPVGLDVDLGMNSSAAGWTSVGPGTRARTAA